DHQQPLPRAPLGPEGFGRSPRSPGTKGSALSANPGGYALAAVSGYPPAMAPMMKKGSFPDATASGSGASGDSRDRSSSQAKNRSIGRRCPVTWSRIVPRSMG